MVGLADMGAKRLGRDERQVGAFGLVLPQEAIGVLVGAPLPGMARMGEVDWQIELPGLRHRTPCFQSTAGLWEWP